MNPGACEVADELRNLWGRRKRETAPIDPEVAQKESRLLLVDIKRHHRAPRELEWIAAAMGAAMASLVAAAAWTLWGPE